MAELKFPLFMDMTGRKVLVVGGGKIAARRVQTLKAFGADITVVAPEVLPEINGVTICKRTFAPGDLDGAFLVLAATDDMELNHTIAAEAAARGILANNASDRRDNDFYFPAVALTEDVSVGICGTGADHRKVAKLAAKIRTFLSGEGRL